MQMKCHRLIPSMTQGKTLNVNLEKYLQKPWNTNISRSAIIVMKLKVTPLDNGF